MKSNKTIPLNISEYIKLDPDSPSYLSWVEHPRFKTWEGKHISSIRKPVNGKYTEGYRVQLNGITYWAHRLVYFLIHGVDPCDYLVEHKDTNPSNNSPDNLRLGTESQNRHNVGRFSSNTSGFKGVTWHKNKNRWQGCVRLFGKSIYVRSKISAEDCFNKLCVARELLHGEFARHE